MKKQPIQSATSLPPSPDAERRGRMIKYTIAMCIRLVCFVVAIFIHSWWALIPIAGALILPYVAVVLANTVVQPKITPVERPGGLVPVSSPHVETKA
jgi:predicted tellurium resistance membrane protein TerC